MNMDASVDTKEDKTKSLAYRLFLSRRDLEWDQQVLADRSGISRGYISKIERGKITNVGKDIIKALAKGLGVSPAYLSGFVDDPLAGIEEEEEEPSAPVDRVAQELLTIYRQLSPQQQATLLNIAKVLSHDPPPKIIGG